jgi:D-3-phosphoglycerate dehydrogenase
MKQPKKRQKILVVDPVHLKALEETRKSFDVDVALNLTKAELIQRIPSYQAIICRTSTPIDKDVIAAATQLRCIGVHATGWDHVDIEAATNRNIAVIGFPTKKRFGKDIAHGSFIPAAEHVLLSMLASAGNYYHMNASMKEGRWEKYLFEGTELYGKTLGIIGLGRIGSLVAQRARAFGMSIIAYSPSLSSQEAKRRGAKKVSLATLCRQSDFISLHIPHTPKTRGFIDAKFLAQVKRGVILINTARDAIIDEPALLQSLDAGVVRMAALDVFDKPLSTTSKALIAHPKVLATPHIAGVSKESLARVSSYIFGSVKKHLKGQRVENIINPHPFRP